MASDLLQILDFLGVGRKAKMDRAAMKENEAIRQQNEFLRGLERQYKPGMMQAELTGKQGANRFTEAQIADLSAKLNEFMQTSPDRQMKLKTEIDAMLAGNDLTRAQTGNIGWNQGFQEKEATTRAGQFDRELAQRVSEAGQRDRLARDQMAMEDRLAQMRNQTDIFRTGMSYSPYGDEFTRKTADEKARLAIGGPASPPPPVKDPRAAQALNMFSQPANPAAADSAQYPWLNTAAKVNNGVMPTSVDQGLQLLHNVNGRPLPQATPKQVPQQAPQIPVQSPWGQQMPSTYVQPPTAPLLTIPQQPKTPSWQQGLTPAQRARPGFTDLINTNVVSPAEMRYRRGF